MKTKTDMCFKDIVLCILSRLESLETQSRVWLTNEQAANYLGISTHTIYQYVSNGKIPFHKIPGSSKLLFKRKEIDDWIEGKTFDNKKLKAEETVNEIWERIN